MILLLDQGLPRSTLTHLYDARIAAVHVADKGLDASSDLEILEYSRQHGMVVVTLDADFHALLALSANPGPSVIRIRIEGLKGDGLARLLVNVLRVCREDLANGAMVSVSERGIRVRHLPISADR